MRHLFFRCGAKFIRSKFSVVLAPFGLCWQWVSRARHFLFDVGFFRTDKVNIPVISVGNIAVGGTGKTPLVIRLAQEYSSTAVAILLRGYGQDEELLFKKRLPQVAIYSHPDRVKSAKLAVANGAKLLILDDGFQHRRLARDVDIVIVRQKDLSGRCLPAGELRDSPHRLKRADIIVLDTEIQTKVLRILTLQGREIASIQGERVGMFCGIGTPEKFKKTLGGLGAEIVDEWILADHEPMGEKRLKIFFDRCKLLGARYLVCTEKDAVKLSSIDLPILFVEIGVEVVGFEKLIAKIEERMYNVLN
jgi:tetraacyldisaccharide 4'-kinase